MGLWNTVDASCFRRQPVVDDLARQDQTSFLSRTRCAMLRLYVHRVRAGRCVGMSAYRMHLECMQMCMLECVHPATHTACVRGVVFVRFRRRNMSKIVAAVPSVQRQRHRVYACACVRACVCVYVCACMYACVHVRWMRAWPWYAGMHASEAMPQTPWFNAMVPWSRPASQMIPSLSVTHEKPLSVPDGTTGPDHTNRSAMKYRRNRRV